MRVPKLYAAARVVAVLLAMASVAVVSPAAQAQALPGGVALGMSVPELQQAQPALQRVRHPARLAGGLVGSWSGAAVDVAGVALVPTFFLADGQLQRVEYLAREGGSGAYDALLAWGRGAWGAELGANGPDGASASWSNEGMDAYLQLAGAGQVRLVVKRRVVKDAEEL